MKIIVNGNGEQLVGLVRYLTNIFLPNGIEFTKSSEISGNKLSIVDVEQFMANANMIKSCILALEWDSLDQNKISKIQKEIEKNFSPIVGLIDLSRPYFTAIPIIKAALEQQTQQVDRLLVQSLEGLKKVRQIHEKVVPLRMEKVKALTAFGKYGAGLGSGGEFYDLVKNESGLFVFMSSSNSYVASSMVLSHFDYLKRKHCARNAIPDFIKNLEQELARLGEKEHNGVHLLAMQVDINQMQIDGHYYGNFWGQNLDTIKFSANKWPVSFAMMEKAEFKYKMKRDEKLVIVSPGLLTNLPVEPQDKFLRDFISNNLKTGSRYILDELFFTLKREDVDHFLNFDATAIVLEVDSNVLVQV